MVAVYRFDESMPISGTSLNFWVFGAEPSRAGKGYGMPLTLQGDLRCGAMDPSDIPETSPEDGGPHLDLIEQELADVETALERLDSGQYWTDEVTGEPLRPEVLEGHPTARRNPL